VATPKFSKLEIDENDHAGHDPYLSLDHSFHTSLTPSPTLVHEIMLAYDLPRSYFLQIPPLHS
jgi:hypothetical protein